MIRRSGYVPFGAPEISVNLKTSFPLPTPVELPQIDSPRVSRLWDTFKYQPLRNVGLVKPDRVVRQSHDVWNVQLVVMNCLPVTANS